MVCYRSVPIMFQPVIVVTGICVTGLWRGHTKDAWPFISTLTLTTIAHIVLRAYKLHSRYYNLYLCERAGVGEH